MKLFKLFSGTTGLNVKVDPTRLTYNPETGVQELSVGLNVDIDNTGRISRRKGFTELSSGDFHSIFCDGGACIFVTGDALCILHDDYTYSSLRNVTPGAKVRACQVNTDIYYCNGYETGIVAMPEGVSAGWTMGTYHGPDTDREFSDPPVGTDIALYKGRIWVVQGNVVWCSEPYGFNLFDLTRSYVAVDSGIRMIRAVRDGFYVSSETKTYFYKGDKVKDLVVTPVANYPVVQYSDVNFHGRMAFPIGGNPFIDYNSGELSAMWMSEKGVCYGGFDGDFRNLTEDKLVLPAAITGSGLFHEGKYIGLFNP